MRAMTYDYGKGIIQKDESPQRAAGKTRPIESVFDKKFKFPK
jgi:hypothetical protein